MTQQRNYSKAAVVLAAGAFLISAGNAGVPAIAGAMAGNSDTVDGFHAVKAGSSVDKRKGKLVATSAQTGRLPDNIIKLAPDSRRLGGQPPSHFLGAADAAATYESQSHAGATYETQAHAATTYATKVQVSASADLTLHVPDETPSPPTGNQATTLFSRPFTLPRAGKVTAETAFQIRVQCAASSDAAAWLTIDGVYVAGSVFIFPQTAGTLTTAIPSGMTASALTAGDHSVTAMAGCWETNISATTFYHPTHFEVVSLGT